LLIALKDAFRPTWKKTAWTIAGAVLLSLAGLILAVMSTHGPDYFTYVAVAFLLPTYLLAKVAPYASLFYSANLTTAVLFAVLQLVYFYTVVCLLFFMWKSRRA
jgi:hypothetical protein